MDNKFLKKITKVEAFERVQESVVRVLNCNKNDLTLETNFIQDLAADSLDLISLVLEFEEITNAEIPDDEARELKNIGQSVDYIMKHCCE